MFLIVLFTVQIILLIGTSTIASATCRKNTDTEESDDSDSPSSSKSYSNSSESKNKPLLYLPLRHVSDMAEDNPHIQFVLGYNKGSLEDFLRNINAVVVSSNLWLWEGKKRILASSAAWKDIAKRVTTLKTEGFDVVAGSDEAKKRRKLMLSQESTKPALLDQIEPKKEKKKKKKSKSNSDGED
ncbi:hypothetical protein DICVIV_01721 [Dictyocaulus viviparus]|uniref:Uncharacterized protein n=1 Tax=Dictyocaulus viviparus TaxID=29172 RepID=A0A0D8Y5W5_DICVI|nr:hypothetical protein DICVIV_01721 [Dictyocaulus viviparus]